MTINDLNNLDKHIETPAFIYDLNALDNRVNMIREILGSRIRLCFSIKANPLLTKYISSKVDMLEVCSPGELAICQSYNIDSKQIILSGVNKTSEEIFQAIKLGVSIFTAESIKQVELLNKVAKNTSHWLSVHLRLSSGSQFGMSQEDLKYVLQHTTDYPNLVFTGIHYFAGTQRTKMATIKSELLMLEQQMVDLNSYINNKLINLEYGPGLAVPYFSNDCFDDTLADLKSIATNLMQLSEKFRLTVEMGRYLTAEMGYYITKVVDIKSINGINYAIVDGGINHVNYYGQTMAMKIPIITHLSRNLHLEENIKHWRLCGSLCTTADILVREIPLNNLDIEDKLIFHNIGAYSNTEGIYLFLSRCMPYIYLYDEYRGAKLVRNKHETYNMNMEDAYGTVN